MSRQATDSRRTAAGRHPWRAGPLCLCIALALSSAPVASQAFIAGTTITGTTIAGTTPLSGGQGIGFKARRSQAQTAGAILSPVAAIDVSRFAFTAPGKGPTRTATTERGFHFTPSSIGDRRPLALAMATHSSAPAATTATQARAASAGDQIGPESYGFDLSVGWKGLALSGDVQRSIGIADSATQAVGLGVSYGGRTWRTGIRASAERGGGPLPMADVGLTERVALEATGAVSVAPSVSLGGSVRYQMAPVNPTPLDMKKDNRAVFVGGKVDF